MTSNFLRPDSWAAPSFTKPDRQICDGLNAPATLIAWYPVGIAYQWFREYYPLNVVVEGIIRFSLIWLVWYVVSIEIGGKGQSILAPKTRMRWVADALAVIFGAVLGAVGLLVSSQAGSYGRLVLTLFLIWAVAIAGFYGHDLWVSFGRVQKPVGE